MNHSEAKDVFTYTWTITNFSMCAQNRDEVLESPLFVSDRFDKTTWCLEIYPRSEDNESISLSLRRCGDVSNPETISIKFTFEVETRVFSKRSSDDIYSYEFKVGSSYVYEGLLRRSSVLSDNCDVLTVRCCMWRSGLGNTTEKEYSVVSESSLESVSDLNVLKERLCASDDDLVAFKCRFAAVECCVHTRINVHRMSVAIPLEKLCKDKLSNKLQLPIISPMENVPSFMVAVQISDSSTMMSIEIRRIVKSSSQHFVVCKITAFNEETSSVLFKSDKYLFCAEKTEDVWYFPDFISIRARRKLNLHCEFAISAKGEEYHMCYTNKAIECQSNRLSIENFNDLTSKLKNLSQCPKLTDSILTCGKQILCVHENVLNASSPVFRSLFKETSRVINIVDLKPNILYKILTFIYTNHLEDIEKDIYELYSAAHKYQVLSLMQYCIEQLKIMMSSHNVYEILILADTYSIVDLFSAIENFIQSNAKEVFHSSAWSDFLNKMPTLAVKISQGILKKVMNI